MQIWSGVGSHFQREPVDADDADALAGCQRPGTGHAPAFAQHLGPDFAAGDLQHFAPGIQQALASADDRPALRFQRHSAAQQDDGRGGRCKPQEQRQQEDDQQAELRRLRAELKRVTEERDILKKAAAYFAKESG